MSLLLNIDTALDTASVCLSCNGKSLAAVSHDNQKDHAAWLHPVIDKIISGTGHTMKQLDAVAVTIGPGSYTGLRVGLAAAKGICYALDIPLITVGTLELMAFAAAREATDLICPVIDARRMEVFMALYNRQEEVLLPPAAIVLDEFDFSLFASRPLLVCGNGRKKLQSFLSGSNITFTDIQASAIDLAIVAGNYYNRQGFASLAYSEPLYIKEFYSNTHKPRP